jgi:hypothetical protein
MKIPIDIFRTHNRNRSLSFINSDQLVNVNKGSRHTKPVTLEKRLALIVVNEGICIFEVLNKLVVVLTENSGKIYIETWKI